MPHTLGMGTKRYVSPLTTEAIEAQLTELAGQPVVVLTRYPHGGLLIAEGAAVKLAKMLGWHSRHNEKGAVYFTGPGAQALLRAGQVAA